MTEHSQLRLPAVTLSLMGPVAVNPVTRRGILLMCEYLPP